MIGRWRRRTEPAPVPVPQPPVPRCGHCFRLLDPDGNSMDFCCHQHQAAWQRTHNGGRPLPGDPDDHGQAAPLGG